MSVNPLFWNLIEMQKYKLEHLEGKQKGDVSIRFSDGYIGIMCKNMVLYLKTNEISIANFYYSRIDHRTETYRKSWNIKNFQKKNS